MKTTTKILRLFMQKNKKEKKNQEIASTSITKT